MTTEEPSLDLEASEEGPPQDLDARGSSSPTAQLWRGPLALAGHVTCELGSDRSPQKPA